MTTILGRCFIAGLLLAALAIAPNHLHAQAGGRGGTVGGRGAPPAAASRSTSAAQATTVHDRVAEDLEAKYQQMANVLWQLPSRGYVVEKGELTKTKLFRADPKLLEKKFVATFSFILLDQSAPRFNEEANMRSADSFLARGMDFGTGMSAYPGELVRLINWNGQQLFLTGSLSNDRAPVPLSDHHKHLLDKCAAENRPPQAMAEFLTSADCDRDVGRTPSVPGAGNTLEWTYHVYAASAEEAEQRCAAIVQLVDGGMSWPMRQYMLVEGRKSLEAARPIFVEVAKQNAVIQVEEEKLAKPTEISSDILSQLKAQKVMVAVELAGLIARVKACDEMLKDPKKLEISTLQSISDMKVKAEIERVGIKEKLDQINAFIGEGDGRQATQDRIAALKTARTPILRRAQTAERAAQTYAGLFDLYAPLPLKDNQITISPVEWTN